MRQSQALPMQLHEKWEKICIKISYHEACIHEPSLTKNVRDIIHDFDNLPIA